MLQKSQNSTLPYVHAVEGSERKKIQKRHAEFPRGFGGRTRLIGRAKNETISKGGVVAKNLWNP